jgi:hypothetical protein
MYQGYHLRFLKVDEAASSIDSADIVRVMLQQADACAYGVQLHARSAPPPQGVDVVLRLLREPNEHENDFVKRAFREAAARQREAN